MASVNSDYLQKRHKETISLKSYKSKEFQFRPFVKLSFSTIQLLFYKMKTEYQSQQYDQIFRFLRSILSLFIFLYILLYCNLTFSRTSSEFHFDIFQVFSLSLLTILSGLFARASTDISTFFQKMETACISQTFSSSVLFFFLERKNFLPKPHRMNRMLRKCLNIVLMGHIIHHVIGG